MAYRATGDKILFFAASMLTAFGLLMVYSASSALATSQYGSPHHYFMRQALYAAAGIVLMIILMNVDYHFWQRRKVLKLLLVLCIATLLLVFLQPKVNAAHRWLRLGPFSFQPSEFAKLGIILFLAAYLHDHAEEINRFRNRLLPCVLVVALIGGLIAIEPDLGQTICFGLIAAGMLFIAGLSWKYIALAGMLAIPALYVAVFTVPFRRDRILAFLNPLQDYLGAGWQISHSLTAVGSGGLFGLGLGESRMKLFFLPEAHSDFIFAVIGEEFGLAGTMLVCLGFLVVFYRGMRITLKAPDLFGFYVALGITLMVALQAFINISMVLALLPTKGIALPFISQGGTSLLLNLVSMGILLNISHHAEKA